MTRRLSGGQALQAAVCGSCCFGRTGKDEQAWLSDDAFWGDLTPSISAEGSHLLTRAERSREWSSAIFEVHPEGLAHPCPLRAAHSPGQTFQPMCPGCHLALRIQ